MTTAAKKPAVKKVFRDIKPVQSKNVTVHFDDAFRVNPRTKFDGYMKQLNGRFGVFVRVPGQGDDIFAVPYSQGADASTRAMESSLRGALKTRKLEVVHVSELKATKK